MRLHQRFGFGLSTFLVMLLGGLLVASVVWNAYFVRQTLARTTKLTQDTAEIVMTLRAQQAAAPGRLAAVVKGLRAALIEELANHDERMVELLRSLRLESRDGTGRVVVVRVPARSPSAKPSPRPSPSPTCTPAQSRRCR